MIIKEISFENFRPYRGNFTVTMSSSPDKNVTLINGENGQGKTSFFTALNWCLYGESSIPKSGLGDRELINKGCLHEASPGEKVVTAVTMKFTRNDHQYIVYRSKTVMKKGKVGTLDYNVIGTDFYIQDLTLGVQKKYGEDAQEILNVILPENVRTYFFFDGERINAFAEARPDEIGLAVRNILKLDLITRAREHLSAISKDLQTESKPFMSKEIQDLLSQQEIVAQQRDAKIEARERFKNELDACRKLRVELQDELDGMQEIQTQMHRRKVIDEQLTKVKDQLKSTKAELKQLQAQSFRLVAHKAFVEAKHVLAQSTQNAGHDSKAIRQVAKIIFDDHHCMYCDRVLEKEDKTRLWNLISSETESQFEYGDLVALAQEVDSAVHEHKRIYRDLNERYKQYRDVSEQANKLASEIKAIDEEIAQSPIDSIQQLSQKRDKCIQDEVRLEMEIRIATDDIESLKQSFNDIVQQRKEREEQISDARQKLDQSDLAEKCIQVLDVIYEDFAEQMRSKIQEETTEVFKSLLIKQLQFQRVELDERYVLSLVDRFGDTNSRNDISAAESQILGLSFILGLANVSECGAPLVIDTPFGRFSERLKRNVLDKLPALVPQLILFVTDSEIGEEEHTILQNRVEYEYTLVNNDANGETAILEGRV